MTKTGTFSGVAIFARDNIWPLPVMEGTMSRRAKRGSQVDLFDYADDNRESLVYLATNSINGKQYVGVTRQTLKRRMGQHITSALRNGDRYSLLHRAIRKYGADAFEFSILAEYPTYKDAAAGEMQWIATLQPAYNSSPGGEAVANIGYRPSPRSIRKMAQTKRKNPTRYWLGKKRPDIAAQQRARLTGRADLVAHMHAKAHTPEARAKMSATKRAKGQSEKHLEAMKRRRKTIVCVDDGRTFIGSQEAADAFGQRQDTILRALRTGRRVKKLTLRYADEVPS